jgi:hypothetical protein
LGLFVGLLNRWTFSWSGPLAVGLVTVGLLAARTLSDAVSTGLQVFRRLLRFAAPR